MEKMLLPSSPTFELSGNIHLAAFAGLNETCSGSVVQHKYRTFSPWIPGDCNRQYEGPVHSYRPQQDSPSPQQPLPPSSQTEGMGPVPRTHRLITLADHICVGLHARASAVGTVPCFHWPFTPHSLKYPWGCLLLQKKLCLPFSLQKEIVLQNSSISAFKIAQFSTCRWPWILMSVWTWGWEGG